jgi:homoserine kinase
VTVIISAPASSANIGPGFDALAIALDTHFSIAINEQPRGGAWEPANDTHPAVVAYKEAGGKTELSKIWCQCQFPFARGMGFSGASRVAGAYAALRESGMAESEARDHAFRYAGDLEGHDDNASASTYGGFCVTTQGHVMRFDCEPESQGLQMVLFIPDVMTSTDKSRTTLPEQYSKEDLVKSIGNVSLLTAMLASNTFNDDVLKLVTDDVIHQPMRLDASKPSKRAYEEFMASGAVTTWLSGSGPSVAALIPEEKVTDVISAMEALELDCTFEIRQLAICQEGVREVSVD